MGLEKYRQKRDFNKTSEPKTNGNPTRTRLAFVVQKHDATRLHYDLRLEMEGVLKSWAVPKGPSLSPRDKRLAMMVEDHPFGYRSFEGNIPQGEYGGGTVIVWDQGWYEPIEPIKGKKSQEKHLLEQLTKGAIKVRLHGQKLNGEFALVHTGGMGENAWLLIKHDDEYADTKDVTSRDKSVLSDKTITQMANSAEDVWTKTGPKKIAAKQPKAKVANGKKSSPHKDAVEVSIAAQQLDATKILKSAPRKSFPKNISPMLATLVDAPFDSEQWQYEVKWDGYRALAIVNKGKVELLSRNNKSFNERFYPIHQLLGKWELNAVIDGELLVLDEKGISNFGALQNWRSEVDGELVFYAFDILWHEGKDLSVLTLVERQAVLNEVLPANDDRIRISRVFDASGLDFFDAASRIGLEGIMAKRKHSTYLPGKRSKDWLKIKVSKRQEVIIAGFTKNKDTSKAFSSLILAVKNKNQLTYVGKVGTGFSDTDQKKLMKMFEPYIIEKSPFKIAPDINKLSRFQQKQLHAKATWMRPELVCEVAFTEITNDGIFRHPAFKGMRTDKEAKDVIVETAVATEGLVADKPTPQKKTKTSGGDTPKIISDELVRPPKETVPKTLLNPKEQSQTKNVNGRALKFNNVQKLYWPEDRISKRDLFNYYYAMAEYILPYLKDRPLSLNRFPGGIHGKSFYQKDVKEKAPEWAKTLPYQTSDGQAKEYLVGDDIATLLWTNTLGCIEANPWFSRIQHPDSPDYCVIDLDPDRHHFDKVIEAANVCREVLDNIGVPSFPKTSGSTGIHIYIPLEAKYNYDQSQLFARIIVGIVNRAIPRFTSIERMISNRNGKMYLDFLQNRPGATIAGPYSLRPKAGATVSMPLNWEELKSGLKMQDFHIHNAFARAREMGDIFKGVLGKGIDLEKAIVKAKELYQ